MVDEIPKIVLETMGKLAKKKAFKNGQEIVVLRGKEIVFIDKNANERIYKLPAEKE